MANMYYKLNLDLIRTNFNCLIKKIEACSVFTKGKRKQFINLFLLRQNISKLDCFLLCEKMISITF